MEGRDRALRLAVADLAAQPRREVDAILDALPEEHARQIAAMLATLNGTRTQAEISHLSPWLAKRVELGHGMTSHATAALAQCARRSAMQHEEPVRVPNPSLISGLFAYLRSMFA